MKILAIHNGHDAAAAIYDDYRRLYIFKEERLSRVKQDGKKFPTMSLQKLKEKVDFSTIDTVVLSKTIFDYSFYKQLPIFKKIEYKIKNKKISLNIYLKKIYDKNIKIEIDKIFDFEKLKTYLDVKKDTKIYFYNHHFSHLIPTLFYSKNWDNALLYSADGGGDFGFYGIYYFKQNKLQPIYEDKYKFIESFNSIGLMYSAVTKALGFKPNRHEGKITGLAAYGKESIAVKEILSKYYIDENGIIQSYFKNYKKDLIPFIVNLSKKVSKEDLAYAAQSILEDIVIQSIKCLKKKYNFSNIGLSGGVFANVKLNQKISELDFIEDVFVFPPMGDEGLVIGGVFEYLIEQKGLENFLSNRVDGMEIPYWGDQYNITKNDIPNNFKIYTDKDIVQNSVELLKQKKICAIFQKRMEYGPRALGARSILIDPSDRSINNTVNKRLNRTEFMPFAPYVRIERVKDIFDFPKSSLRAMKYMTITCDVKDEWKEKIQATVHIDGTARPQTIKREDNELYYDILNEFEKQTGLPCLVNTSFNAHEEPIINTFEEALIALKNNRIDYLITEKFIIQNKN